MGNVIGACCLASKGSFVKVIYWEGDTKILSGKGGAAGEIMFEFPESIVRDADRFFIGHPIPALSIHDQLQLGKTYFVLPLDVFSSQILSSSTISAFVTRTPRRIASELKESPLEYIKGSNGKFLMKVKPEYMAKNLTSRGGRDGHQENEYTNNNANDSSVCSTPELKMKYEQLVGSKWSPDLETVSEAKKIRLSPYRFIGG